MRDLIKKVYFYEESLYKKKQNLYTVSTLIDLSEDEEEMIER